MFAILLSALVAATPAPASAFTQHVVLAPVSVSPVTEPPTRLIEKARTAQAAGDLATAYTEFSRAVRMQRADGVLSVDASYGAAHVLTMQSRFREAADVLDQLAADAYLLGDAETEARVLLDVVAIKVNHRRAPAARADAYRLKTLLTDVRLTSDTRRLIKARLS
jgi:hypothetical protein